jgi:hypothetical protein
VTSIALVRCDGCGKAELDNPVFPRGWLRLHAYGRRRGEPVRDKIDAIDVCSPECVEKAVAPLFGQLA